MLLKSGAIVWLLWTSLPIDSDKVVYAIAKTLPIRKNLKRNEMLELLDLSKITDSETLEFISLLKSSTEGLRQTLNEYIANKKKCNQFPY
jgi:hypothetical protein